MDELLDPNISNQNNFQGGGQRTLPNSTAVLVLGIISIVGCIFYGVPGLVCGIIAIFLHKKVIVSRIDLTKENREEEGIRLTSKYSPIFFVQFKCTNFSVVFIKAR